MVNFNSEATSVDFTDQLNLDNNPGQVVLSTLGLDSTFQLGQVNLLSLLLNKKFISIFFTFRDEVDLTALTLGPNEGLLIDL